MRILTGHHEHRIRCRSCPEALESSRCDACGYLHDDREPCLRSAVEQRLRERAESLAYERMEEAEL